MPHIIRKEKKKISLRQYDLKGKVQGKISPVEALFYALPKGSFTLEAALVLPFFLFAVAALCSLFLMMQAQYTVGNSLDRAVAETSLLGANSGKKAENLTKASFYKELVKQKRYLSLIQGGAGGFTWKGTADGANINLMVTYRLKFPIAFWNTQTMKVSDSRRMHRWTGDQRDGKDGSKDQWVFVTPNQSVYHKSRNCSHLKLSVKSCSASIIGTAACSYEPCGHCTRGQKKGTVVYVTKEGDCYHYRINCSGLKRTIYMVKKKEAGGKRACSRCGGR